MVSVTIFIEGGVHPHDNDSVRTIDNSEKLREGFYSILSQTIPQNKFNVSIKLGGGCHHTIKFFKSKINKQHNSILLIDLDDDKSKKNDKIAELELNNIKENIFFMVQEMEAWIISQIDKVDLHYKDKFTRKKPDIKLSDDEKIKSIHPEDIIKPSKVLKVILGRYFAYYTKKKNKKYGKLKDGADLLSILSANELRNTFSDFNDLIIKIEQF